MEHFAFYIKENEYTGHIVVSRKRQAYFYWCLLDDCELVQEIGDYIAFTDEGGDIEPLDIFPSKYNTVIAALKEKVTEWVNRVETV